MDLPRILPWLNWGEWNKGRELLYSPNFSDKVAGVGLTRVWRSRGKVPHAVDATAQLVEAVLCDQAYFLDRTGNSTSSAEAGSEGNFVETRSEIERRLLHATAVLRCVNGLVEPGQKGVAAAPVQSLARNVGLPAWVVDMRHEISHKELPSLSTLRLGSDFLLKYLWGNCQFYPDAWGVILGQLKDTSVAGVEMNAALRDLLHSVPPTSIPWGLIPLLTNGTPAVSDCLAPISVDDNHESVNEIISRWSPVVSLLCQNWEGFGPALLVFLVEQLVFQDEKNRSSLDRPTNRHTLLLSWILHLLNFEMLRAGDDDMSASHLQNIGYPVIELLGRCNNVCEGSNEAAAVAAVLASFVPTSKHITTAAEGGNDQNLGLKEVEALLDYSSHSVSEPDSISWKRCTTWTPCAIGVLPGYSSSATNLVAVKEKR